MIDLAIGLGWIAVLAAGIVIAVVLRRSGIPATYTRDLVHVGAGVWVLGWPCWRSWVVPVAIPVVACAAVLALPIVRTPAAIRVRDALAHGDERWSGVALYTVSYALFTALAFIDAPVPAGAALLALSLGDGLGGLVGRRLGAHVFTVPGGKPKSLEGSSTVAVLSVVAVLAAAKRLGGPSRPALAMLAGAVAAAVEAAAPRGTDNLLLPLAVWTTLRLAS